MTISNLNDSERYTPTAIALHWLMALLIIGLLALGYYMADLPKGVPNRADFFNLHKSLGLLAGILIVLRLYWRRKHPAPSLPASMPNWTRQAADWGHRLLYICMVLQPVSGYLSSSFNKYGVKFFGLPLPKWTDEDANLSHLFKESHEFIATLLVALIVLHVLAALKHKLIDRDQIVQRMLPGKRT